MKKIVINRCFGGFSLSEDAVKRYAELKGIPLFIERDEKYSSLGFCTYWTKPANERPAEIPGPWASHSQEARIAYNEAYSASTIDPREIPRDDSELVRVVEELGTAANGRCASLSIVEIPEDVEWEISEYDGNEHVAEVHRTWP